MEFGLGRIGIIEIGELENWKIDETSEQFHAEFWNGNSRVGRCLAAIMIPKDRIVSGSKIRSVFRGRVATISIAVPPERNPFPDRISRSQEFSECPRFHDLRLVILHSYASFSIPVNLRGRLDLHAADYPFFLP